MAINIVNQKLQNKQLFNLFNTSTIYMLNFQKGTRLIQLIVTGANNSTNATRGIHCYICQNP